MIERLAETCRDELEWNGYVLIPDFLGDDELARGQDRIRQHVPTPDEFFSTGRHKHAEIRQPAQGGPGRTIQFPIGDEVLDDQLTSPRLIQLFQAILDTLDIRLANHAGGLMTKYGGNEDHDQELHIDGSSIAVPGQELFRKQIAYFLYYSDVTEECGPTRVLPHTHSKRARFEEARWHPAGVARFSRDKHPDLYAQEVAMVGPAGSLLLFTSDTLHRGTALGPPPAYRWTTFGSFHAAGHDWISNFYSRRNGDDVLDCITAFITRATPGQRSLLGFPLPGDAYWNDMTLAGVAARYPGIDLSPY